MASVEQGGGAAGAAVRLTKRAIDQAKPLPEPYFVWDGELKGFGARIDPGGAKTFAVRYRPKGHGASAPKRFITIGRYGPLTVDEARNRAKEILGAAATGADPAADLAFRRAASTFKEIADLFLKEHAGPKRKFSTTQSYESLLNAYAIPALGNRKAEGVTRAEVARLHGQIGDRPYQANRLLAVIGSLYTFAERHGLVPENCNPARKIEKFPEDRRERFLTPDELERLGAAIREGETLGICLAGGRRRAEIKASCQERKPAHLSVARRCFCASPPDFHRCPAARNPPPALGACRFGAWSFIAAGLKDWAEDDRVKPPRSRYPSDASAQRLVRHWRCPY
jgi:hypothetical protein